LLPALAASLEQNKWSAAERRAIVEFYGTFRGEDPAALQPLQVRLAMPRPFGTSADRAKRRATIAAALAKLGQPDVAWPLLVHQGNPTLRSFLIERLGSTGVDLEVLANRLRTEQDLAVRRALILAIGEYPSDRMPELIPYLLELYKEHPDPGVHAAAGWVLRSWDRFVQVAAIDAELATGQIKEGRSWLVNKEGQTFSVIEQPRSLPLGIGERLKLPPHRFAIAATEVTVHDFLTFVGHGFSVDPRSTPLSPINSVKWYQAAAYCNWLSEREGLQPCYELVDNKLEFVPDYQRLSGYRLPTVDEWEFACRAGAETLFCFGEPAEELLNLYVCYNANSRGDDGVRRPSAVGSHLPNDWGLFDMHGNVAEWCQELPGLPGAIYGEPLCAVRGGHFVDDVNSLKRSIETLRATHMTTLGFRPVRTLRGPSDGR